MSTDEMWAMAYAVVIFIGAVIFAYSGLADRIFGGDKC